jgi:hypothetical protein
MDPEVETKRSSAVEAAVHSIYKVIFPQGDHAFVTRVFGWAMDCFSGKYRDYQAIDARYHDLEHTLQGTLCFARLLHGYHAARCSPALTQRGFELGLIAILLHDSGYLKTRDDTEGTGAKYTLTHVSRSVAFAEVLLGERGLAENEIRAVQNMIRCTGVNVDLKSIPFGNPLERNVGFALGTADLLGQMAAKDYVEKLPILYSEFEESARFNAAQSRGEVAIKSARDLMEKTPAFWEKYALPKIQNDFGGMYRFLNSPFPDGPNFYLKRIEGNIARLKELLDA